MKHNVKTSLLPIRCHVNNMSKQYSIQSDISSLNVIVFTLIRISLMTYQEKHFIKKKTFYNGEANSQHFVEYLFNHLEIQIMSIPHLKSNWIKKIYTQDCRPRSLDLGNLPRTRAIWYYTEGRYGVKVRQKTQRLTGCNQGTIQNS